MPNQSWLEISVDKADEEEGGAEVRDEEEPCCIATVCREEVEAAAQDMILEQNMTLPRIGSEEVGGGCCFCFVLVLNVALRRGNIFPKVWETAVRKQRDVSPQVFFPIPLST